MFTLKIQVQYLGSVSYSEFRFYVYKMLKGGTSLVVQWLRLRLLVQEVWVGSLAGELRPYMPQGQNTKM